MFNHSIIQTIHQLVKKLIVQIFCIIRLKSCGVTYFNILNTLLSKAAVVDDMWIHSRLVPARDGTFEPRKRDKNPCNLALCQLEKGPNGMVGQEKKVLGAQHLP